ncbi:hypothetical protein [Acidovorax sp. FG27]|uniref:hypothetical protein n=1 Tax=Acidovorax sp. FG27 TaxID=3133652 RepID=UPI0033415E23
MQARKFELIQAVAQQSHERGLSFVACIPLRPMFYVGWAAIMRAPGFHFSRA